MSILIPSDWRRRVALLRIQAEDLGGMASALAEEGNYRSEDPIFKASVVLRQLCERRQAAADWVAYTILEGNWHCPARRIRA